MKRIAITGPECTGKTMLAQQLAEHFKTSWVPEYAREYLGQRGRNYAYEDISEIAKGQIRTEEELSVKATGFLFCDTCLLVCKVWSLHKFGKVESWITDAIESSPYDLYLLPAPDITWVSDPLRENPEDRWQLFERYREELADLGRSWVELSGSWNQRVEAAVSAVEDLA